MNIEQGDIYGICKIFPDMIHNRPDKMGMEDIALLEVSDCNEDTYVFISNSGGKVNVHCWGMCLSYEQVEKIKQYVFSKFFKAKQIMFINPVINDIAIDNIHKMRNSKVYSTRKNWRVDCVLYQGSGVQIGKKSLYNLKRSRRLLEEKIGRVEFKHFTRQDKEFYVFLKDYLKFKLLTLGTDYRMSEVEYADKYFVTDCYVLGASAPVAILLSCEQCEYIYIENLTYDMNFSQYSPGMLLYYDFLKYIIDNRQHAGVFLGTGDYLYKSRFGSVYDEVTTFIVFKTTYEKLKFELKHFFDKLFEKFILLLPRGWKELIKKVVKRTLGIKEFHGVRI